MTKASIKLIILIFYIAFLTFFYIGAAFITNTLFNIEYNLSNVGLDNNAKVGLTRFTIVIFWIVFIPLSLLPFIKLFGIDIL
jgi:hypothetical protein